MSPLSESFKTRLIRPRTQGRLPWWRTAAVCELAAVSSLDQLVRLSNLIPSVRENGFDAILVQLDCSVTQQLCGALTSFARAAHRGGVRVILSLPFPEVAAFQDELDLLWQQTREQVPELPAARNTTYEIWRRYFGSLEKLLGVGADGLDLGLLEDTNEQVITGTERTHYLSRLRLLQSAQLFEYKGSTILAGSVNLIPEESFTSHLQEEWLVHLRTEALMETPWEAASLQQRVEFEFTARNPWERAPVWDLCTRLPQDMLVAHPGSGRFDRETNETNALRFLTLELFALSLPGVAYLLSPFVSVQTAPQQIRPLVDLLAEADLSRYRRSLLTDALQLRKQLRFASERLEFVEDCEWLPAQAHAHICGQALVVFNPTRQEIQVPKEFPLLLSSSIYTYSGAQGTRLGANACAWFQIRD